MRRRNSITAFAALLVAGIVGSTSVAEAATLQMMAKRSTLAPGEATTVSVVLDAGGVPVNNAEALIQVPSEYLDVVSINTSGSIFTLWVEEPSQGPGTVSFNGGLPTPGYSGTNGTVISFTVKAKKAGTADIVFSSAAVRANDGLGTDVLAGTTGTKLQVAAALPTPSVPTPAKTTPLAPASTAPVSGTTATLRIASAGHPDQDQWYIDPSPLFTWEIPAGADAIQTGMSLASQDAPRTMHVPAVSSRQFTGLDDGVWYFKARARVKGVWGPSTTHIVRIDTTAPADRGVLFDYDDSNATLTIRADIQDLTSGLDRYEIRINGALIKSVPAKEFVGGAYTLQYPAVGTSTVSLTAIDRAGNTVEASGSFASTRVAAPVLENVRPLVSAGARLPVFGTTSAPGADVTVSFVRNHEAPVQVRTRANSEGDFIVLSPTLEAGTYEIWAESGSSPYIGSSAHVRTVATEHTVLTLGSYTARADRAISGLGLVVAALLAGLISLAWVNRRRGGRRHRTEPR